MPNISRGFSQLAQSPVFSNAAGLMDVTYASNNQVTSIKVEGLDPSASCMLMYVDKCLESPLPGQLLTLLEAFLVPLDNTSTIP